MYHAFLNEELSSFQMSCHVLAQTLTFCLVQDLSEESANLQENRKAPQIQFHTGLDYATFWSSMRSLVHVTRRYLSHVVLIRAVVPSDIRRGSKFGLHKAWLTIRGTEAVGEVVWGSPCKNKQTNTHKKNSYQLCRMELELWSVQEVLSLNICPGVCTVCTMRISHPGCQSCTWVHLSGSWPRGHDKGS